MKNTNHPTPKFVFWIGEIILFHHYSVCIYAQKSKRIKVQIFTLKVNQCQALNSLRKGHNGGRYMG